MYKPKLVTVSYPNHHKVFTERIWNLFTTKHKVDLNLLTYDETSRIGVHQLVLEIFVPHIAKLLQEQTKSHDVIGSYGDTIPCLAMTGQTASGLQLLIELVYCGTVGVTVEQLDTLKKIASEMDVPLQVDDSVDKLPVTSSKIDQKEDCRNLRARTNKRKGRPKKYVVKSSCSSSEASPDRASTNRKKRQIKTKIVVASKKSKLTSTRQKSKIEEDSRSKSLPETKPSVTDVDQPDVVDNQIDDGSRHSDDDSEKSSLDDSVVKKTKKCPPTKRRKSSRSGEVTLTKGGNVSRALYQQKWRQALSIQRCTHCEYETTDKLKLAVHINAKHDPSVVVLKCLVCNRPFLSEQALERHEKLHHADKDAIFRCDHCDYTSPTRINYYRHLTTMHKITISGEVLKDRYHCEHCDFACLYKSQLTYHQETLHATEKRFKCEHCPYASSRKGDLGKHVNLLHLGGSELRIICDICGYRCIDRGILKRHLRSHTGERPFVCTTCGKAYAHSNKLKIHMESHSGSQRQFTCHLCGHQCRRKDNLLVHLRSCSTRIKPVPDLRNSNSGSH